MNNPCLSRPEFQLIAGLMMAAIGKEMPPPQLEAYYELLNDIPANVLRASVARALEESDQNFIPAIGMIRRLAAEAQFGVLPAWGAEWERVLTCCRKFGRSRPIDAMTALGEFTWGIVRQVGWESICNSETPGVQMALFRSCYESAVQQEQTHRRISEELRPKIGTGKLLTTVPVKRLPVKS